MSSSGARARAYFRYLNKVATSLQIDRDTAKNLNQLDYYDFWAQVKEYNKFRRRLYRAYKTFITKYPWPDAFDKDPIQSFDPPPKRRNFIKSENA